MTWLSTTNPADQVKALAEALGFKDLPQVELELIGAAVVGLIDVLGGAAIKRAQVAGKSAADKITTADEADDFEMGRR